MKHGSLFSGIGGFDLAAQWMGWENVFHCEKKEFCRRVLSYYWPTAKSYEDVTTTDFTIWRGRVDILSGGFPCQPYSTAGKRKGKEDDRHLWPEMLRAIREIQPRFVVGENVRGLLSWNEGMVFNEVQSDLEAEGYDVLPFLLPACSINAPHERYRIWFIAYSRNSLHTGGLEPGGYTEAPGGSKGKDQQQRRWDALRQRLWVELGASGADVTDASGTGCQKQHVPSVTIKEGHCSGRNNENVADTTSGGRIQDYSSTISEQFTQGVPDWRSFPTQSPLCNGNDGLSSRLDGITISKHRRSSIEAGGNAIVPGLALQIFKAIEIINFQIA
ncbi:MAG: DNA cytosine methyltransferase [Thiotrichales bacterium]